MPPSSHGLRSCQLTTVYPVPTLVILVAQHLAELVIAESNLSVLLFPLLVRSSFLDSHRNGHTIAHPQDVMPPAHRDHREADMPLHVLIYRDTANTATLSTLSLPTILPPSAVIGTSTDVSASVQDTPTPPLNSTSMSPGRWQSKQPPDSSNPPASSSNPSFVNGLLGGILGCLIASLFVLVGLFFFRRYRRSRRGQEIRNESRPHAQRSESSVESTQTGWTISALSSIHGSRDTNSTSSLLPPSTRRSSLSSMDFSSPRPHSDATRASLRAVTPLPPVETTASSTHTLPATSSISLFETAFVAMSAGPPSHSVDVPDPALSVTGTDRSLRYDELNRQIQALEAEVQDLHYPGKPNDRQSSVPGEQGRTNARMKALKDEIAELRAQVRRERRLMMEAAPRRGRRGKALTLVT
ncbi:hypothetical protein NUW54_g3755 [Trametes sanguinea]|uniref:Uncharacterized protein n=1 Tax=Trametes sanguinea TaxID=158606 RepID=A0ACC1Q020_9APHY|nr:hypothetical protein NUW54_g3755 [Trametes sanguinea]